MSEIFDLEKYITDQLKDCSINTSISNNNLFLKCNKRDLINVINFLKNDKKTSFSQLIDITAVDHINNDKRFEVIYILLSIEFNYRIIIKIFISEDESVPSISDIYKSSNWYERECYDLFGIIFTNHPDLRRIMMDYNFVGHPLRKDFPLTGHTEVRYDDLQKKFIFETVKLAQDYRNFDFTSPW